MQSENLVTSLDQRLGVRKGQTVGEWGGVGMGEGDEQAGEWREDGGTQPCPSRR